MAQNKGALAFMAQRQNTRLAGAWPRVWFHKECVRRSEERVLFVFKENVSAALLCLELLNSSHPPTLASQIAGIEGRAATLGSHSNVNRNSNH